MEAKKRIRRREEIAEEDASPEPIDLPPEIIREILIRLPATSIGRFRCVSKLFRSLSSDPKFAKSHLDLTIHRKLIISGHSVYALDLDRIGDGFEGIIDLDAVELNYPLKDAPSQFREMVQSIIREDDVDENLKIRLNEELYLSNWVQFIGYSNGLVCVSPCEGALFLYNPTTGESKRLPEMKKIAGEEVFQTHGFGFDDLSGDYKVVKLASDVECVRSASVYSLKADTWRRICDLNYEHDESVVAGVNVNGAIHWVFTLPDANRRFVLAFDVNTEEFREMSLPGEAAEDVSRDFIAGDINGRLCVINSCDEADDDIWVMNDYGAASSWTRIRFRFVFRCMRPPCSTQNYDEVLLGFYGDMVLHNFRTDSWRYLRIRGAKLEGRFEAHTYIESLVSPNLYVVGN